VSAALPPILAVKELSARYGSVEALHAASLSVADGEFMRSRIPGASMTILDAAHISNVEQPHAFTDALVGFLTQR